MRRVLDVSPPPTERRAREAWLLAQERSVSRLCRGKLTAIVNAASDRLSASLTASAVDLTLLDSIPAEWAAFVTGELAPRLGVLNMQGAMSAWVGAKRVIDRLPEFADRWAAVVNEAAVSYQAAATNRLVGVGDKVWRDVRAQTVNAVEKGLTNEELKAQIEDTTGFSEYRADTIARTETIAAYVQGDLSAQTALGDDGPVEKVWVATLDERTRESHADAHDQCVPMGDSFDVDGEMMDVPHDPSAPAGEVVNCRCYVEYLYPGDTRPDGSIVPGGESDSSSSDAADDEPADE